MSRAARAAGVTLASAVLVATPTAAYAFDPVPDGEPYRLVVGDAAVLTAADQHLKSSLELLNYEVTVVSDTAPAADNASVLIAPSVNQAELGAKYAAITHSILALETEAWFDLKLATTQGGVWETNTLLVVDGTHPVAEGLPSSFAASYGKPLRSIDEINLPVGADPVVVRSGSPTAHVVYTINRGAPLADGSAAPGPRGVLGLGETSIIDLTENGDVLLDNMMYWADTADNTGATPDAVPAPTSEVTVDASGNAYAEATGLTQVGLWKLDDEVGDGRTPGSGTGVPSGLLEAGTTVTKADRVANGVTGNFSYDFPGWTQATQTPGGLWQVPKAKGAVRFPDSDNLRKRYNPRARAFHWAAYVSPDNSKDSNSTAATRLKGDATLNIMQKGLLADSNGTSADTKHIWKMSVEARSMKAQCAVAGDTPAGVNRTYQITSIDDMVTEGRHQVVCDYYNRKQVRVSLKARSGAGTFVPQQGGTSASGEVLTVNTSVEMYFGKKVASLDASDAFAGRIDNVVIKRQGGLAD